jgi:hypothetical protein
MISRSTLEAANRVAEYVARRPIVLDLSALPTPPAVDEPKPDAAGVNTLASWPAQAKKAESDDAD